MLEDKGRFINRLIRTGGKLYDKFFIYIPTDVVKDSSFPFKEREVGLELIGRITGLSQKS